MSRRKQFVPANGSHGDWFIGKFCENCKHDINENCSILAKSYRVWPKGVKEWIYDKDDQPMCTEYVNRKEPHDEHCPCRDCVTVREKLKSWNKMFTPQPTTRADAQRDE